MNTHTHAYKCSAWHWSPCPPPGLCSNHLMPTAAGSIESGAQGGLVWVTLILMVQQFPVYPDGHTTNSAHQSASAKIASHIGTRTQNTHLQCCLADLVQNHESPRWCQPSWQVWLGTAATIHGDTVQQSNTERAANPGQRVRVSSDHFRDVASCTAGQKAVECENKREKERKKHCRMF